MTAPLFMGIDGGGSNLRIVIVNAKLEIICAHTGGSANPSLIGRDRSQAKLHHGIAQALAKASLRHEDIAALAIGIAGASKTHSLDWLMKTVRHALPKCLIAASSDLEIALVGAHGRRLGILLLAGTGSAVYGIGRDARELQIGGWGYLLGDQGSGFWIGRQILRQVITEADQDAPIQADSLSRQCLDALALRQPRDLIHWLYRSDDAPIAQVASLAEVALKAANCGDCQAKAIITAAAEHLARQAGLMRARLHWQDAPIAFAGGLLDNDNPLSLALARRLGLEQRPIAKHTPVLGAAILAMWHWRATRPT